MTELTNGPYNYRVDDSRPPIVVEIFHGFVAEVGEPDWRPLSGYKGTFIRLVEVATVKAAKEEASE